MTTRTSVQRKEGAKVYQLDDGRFAYSVDGLIRYVGTHAECARRANAAADVPTRDRQDRMLRRAVR